MRNNKLNTIAINNGKKPSNHFNLDYGINTTASIGTLQPVAFQDMEPNDTVHFGMNSLLRAAAMVAPAWLKLKWNYVAQFVPIKAVFPNMPEFMTGVKKQTSVAHFVPNKFPEITEGQLTALTLIGAKPSIWSRHKETVNDVERWTPWIKPIDMSKKQEVFNTLYQNYNGDGAFSYGPCTHFGFTGDAHRMDLNWMYKHSTGWFGTKNLIDLPSLWVPCGSQKEEAFYGNTDITPDHCDIFMISRSYELTVWKGNEMAVAWRRSLAGSLFAKVLTGLGYRMDLRSEKKVSLLPLLAWYYAYFNAYGVERTRSWESTNCHALIEYIAQYNFTDFTYDYNDGEANREGWNNLDSRFWQFVIHELFQSFYPTQDYDFVSAHRDVIGDANRPLTGFSNDFNTSRRSDLVSLVNDSINSLVGGNLGSQNHSTTGISSNGDARIFNIETDYEDASVLTTALPLQIKNGATSLSATTIEALKRLALVTSKFDVLGQNVRSLLKALGYGDYCEKIVQYVGSRSMDLNITDVTALADTYSNDAGISHGLKAGEQVGKSITSSSEPGKRDFATPMKFSTDERGFFIVMASIVPESGYVNMANKKHYATTRSGQYDKQFEGLGYEATTKEELFGDSRVARHSDTKQHTFGFVPHWSSLKVKSNIMNGDFNRGSKRDAILPYSGDKLVRIRDVNGTTSTWIDNDSYLASTFNEYKTSPDNIPVAGEIWKSAYRLGFLGSLNRAFVNWDSTESITDEARQQSILYPVLLTEYNEWIYELDDNFIVHCKVDMSLDSQMSPIGETFMTTNDEDPANASVELS